MERAVCFPNNRGLQLVAVHHLPDENPKRTGILFVHSGTQGRLGNTNQYVYYARAFAQQGFPCLRFDPNGLGDSAGLIGEVDRRNFFGSVQTGRYVADVLAAIDEFKRTGVEQVVLIGVCGGAISALLAGADRRDVCGMILMSCPVVIDGADVDYDARIPAALARREIWVYLKKLLRISAIWRFITFQSEYRRIITRLLASLRFTRDKCGDTGGEPAGLKGAQINRLFFDSYKKCGRKNILWIYGSNDQFWFEFQRAALDRLNIGSTDELHLVHNGNHMFTLPEWQHELRDVALEWLARREYR